MTTNDVSDSKISAGLEKLVAEARYACAHPHVHFHYSDGPRVMTALADAVEALASRHQEPVNEPGEMVAALRKAQSAIASCLSAGGIVGSTEAPASWWDEIISAQQSIAAALTAALQTKQESGECT